MDQDIIINELFWHNVPPATLHQISECKDLDIIKTLISLEGFTIDNEEIKQLRIKFKTELNINFTDFNILLNRFNIRSSDGVRTIGWNSNGNEISIIRGGGTRKKRKSMKKYKSKTKRKIKDNHKCKRKKSRKSKKTKKRRR